MLQTIFLTVVNMSITASAAILLVLPARLLLRRAPKVFSYALWAVVLFRLLCPVSLPSVISLYNVLEAPAAGAGPVGHMAYLPLPFDGEAAPAIPAAPAGQAEAAPAPAAAPKIKDILLSPLSAAGILWLSGAVTLALLNAVRWVRLRRRLLCALPLRENICLADHIPVPFVMGLVRPRIYLPSDLAEAEQAYIIRHEQHHIRRGDPLFRLLAFAALCVHWFNPLVWLAFTLAGRDMELSCDEAVLRQAGGQIRADYSLSLLRYSVGKHRFIGAPLAFGVGDTRERIENVMKYKKPTVPAVALAAALCISLTACLSFNPRSGGIPAAPASDTPATPAPTPSETPLPEEMETFTGFITQISPEDNALQVATEPKYGFSLADRVTVYLPDTLRAEEQGLGSAVRIAFSGEPEVGASVGETGTEAATAVLRAEQVVDIQDYLVLNDDSTGTLSELVYVGKYCALVTVEFTYEQDGAHLMVRDITEARAENVAGWWSVRADIQIDTQGIVTSKNGMEAIIPFAYYASIGEGWAEYSGVAVIDLSAFDPSI